MTGLDRTGQDWTSQAKTSADRAAMIEASRELAPDVPIKIESTITKRYGK